MVRAPSLAPFLQDTLSMRFSFAFCSVAALSLAASLPALAQGAKAPAKSFSPTVNRYFTNLGDILAHEEVGPAHPGPGPAGAQTVRRRRSAARPIGAPRCPFVMTPVPLTVPRWVILDRSHVQGEHP